MDEINRLTQKIIGCAIEVHKQLGPGLLESVYEAALCIEFEEINIRFERQKSLSVNYKNRSIGEFRIDILVENIVVLELKSVERHDPLFEAQLLSYLKSGNYRVRLLINFNTRLLKNGIKRLIL
ncbi:MAG: GxxExxY protein [Calditrichaeota bacterium]|nr:GxxExxY protein [Calditrichota bacterium]